MSDIFAMASESIQLIRVAPDQGLHTENDRVSTQEQLADESLLVDGLCLLALGRTWHFCPHLPE